MNTITRKPRMSKNEKMFYKAVFPAVKDGTASQKVVSAWLWLHQTKTY